MKAVLILFSNDFVNEEARAQAISTIAQIIGQTTNSSGTNCVDILEYDDTEIAKLLIADAVNTSAKHSSKTTLEDELLNLCIKLRERLGSPLDSDEVVFKTRLAKELVSDKEIREHNTRVLKYLLGDGKLQRSINKILAEQNMESLPRYLKEINNFIHLF